MFGFVRFVLTVSFLSSSFLLALFPLRSLERSSFMNNDTSKLLGANYFLPDFEAPRKFVSAALGLVA